MVFAMIFASLRCPHASMQEDFSVMEPLVRKKYLFSYKQYRHGKEKTLGAV